jgi:peptide-methionine (S)-S-oxide reductase
MEAPMASKHSPAAASTELATFGAGCFWCVEAVFQRVEGVRKVVSGYAGGDVEDPTYRQVCEGTTGHAEVVQIEFDPMKVSYVDLLEVFWKTHDPTTRDRQGNDVGPQYRSVVFFHNEEQRSLAERIRRELDASGAWSGPIVTEIAPLTRFYPAEDYHQDYFNRNPEQSYCRFVIRPKIEKFEKVFREKARPGDGR